MSLSTVTRPKQARSEQTLARLLDAAQALIEEQGLGALSIPACVRRARSSVGGFYARFRDKDELLRALEERFFGELEAELVEVTRPERWETASAHEVVRGLIATLVSVYGARRRLIKAFIVRSASDEHTWREGLRLRRRVHERLGQLLLARPSAIRHPHPERAIELGIHMVFGVMQQKAIFGEVRAGGAALEDGELVAELTQALESYLGISAPSAA